MMRSMELEQRRSFSFSSFDFNSCNFGVFSSDDDVKYHIHSNMDDVDEDEGAYIEISINNPHRPNSTLAQTSQLLFHDEEVVGNMNNIKNVHKKEEEEEHVELIPISFSSLSSVSSPKAMRRSASSNVAQHMHSSSELPGHKEDKNNDSSNVVDAGGRTRNKTRLQRRLFSSFNCMVNHESVLGSSTVTHAAYDHPSITKTYCRDMILSKGKACKMVTRKSNNGTNNLIVKFSYKSIPSMLFSLVKPKPRSPQEKPHKQQRLRQQGSRKNGNINHKHKASNSDYQQLNHEKSTSSVAGVINLNAIRGVLDSIFSTTRQYAARVPSPSSSGKYKKSKSISCPNSIKSSPMHYNGGGAQVKDNSVQAAIAHCKKSFGAESELDFHL